MERTLLKSIFMKRKSSPKAPTRSSQVPATSAMLYEMEERLSHKMESGFYQLKSEMKAELRQEIGGVRSELKREIGGLKGEINAIKSDIGGIKSDISGIKSELSGVKSELHRVALLVEEQNARNKYVMDGYAQLYELLALRNQ